LSNGVLAITSNSGNQITVKELKTQGSYSVNAADLNGNTPVNFSGVSSITVHDSGNQTVLFAGYSGDTITADTTHLTGSLTVTGSGALTVDVQSFFNVNGAFTVNHSGNQALNVTATDQGTTLGKTTINNTSSGAASVTFINGVKFLSSASLNLGDGADSVTLGSKSTLPGPHFGTFLSVMTGAGNDTVNVFGAVIGQNFGLALSSGTNQITVDSATIHGNLTVSDSGTEKFTFQDSSIVHGNMSINYGSSNPATVIIGGGNGSPDAVIGGFLSVTSGAGADSISVTGARIGTNFAFSLGSGANVVSIQTTTIGGNLTGTDNGAETFSLTKNSTVTGNVSLNYIPATSDSVTIGGSTTYPTVTIDGFLSIMCNGNNTITVQGTAVGTDFAMALGAGTDSVKITNSTVQGNLSCTASGKETYVVDSVTVGGTLFLNSSSSTAKEKITMDSVSITGASQIDIGGAADSVAIGESTFSGAFGMVTGNGNDTVVLGPHQDNTTNTVFFGTVEVSFGNGSNTLILGKDSDSTEGAEVNLEVFYGTVKFQAGSGSNKYTDNDGQFLGGPPVRIHI
jgi:hypothetical protein